MSKHGPNSWDNYQAVHQRWMKDFEHFIEEDALTATATNTFVSWHGMRYCVGGIEIKVTKDQRADYRSGQLMVETAEYSYHALRRIGTRVINLLRYDNAHEHPGHPDAHHRHSYDAEGDELEPPTHVGVDGWPTLGEFVREVYEMTQAPT